MESSTLYVHDSHAVRVPYALLNAIIDHTLPFASKACPGLIRKCDVYTGYVCMTLSDFDYIKTTLKCRGIGSVNGQGL